MKNTHKTGHQRVNRASPQFWKSILYNIINTHVKDIYQMLTLVSLDCDVMSDLGFLHYSFPYFTNILQCQILLLQSETKTMSNIGE